jgi:hypothetical protein
MKKIESNVNSTLRNGKEQVKPFVNSKLTPHYGGIKARRAGTRKLGASWMLTSCELASWTASCSQAGKLDKL